MSLTDRVALLIYKPDDPYSDYRDYRVGLEPSTDIIRVYANTDDGWDAFAEFERGNKDREDIIDAAQDSIVEWGYEPAGKTPANIITTDD